MTQPNATELIEQTLDWVTYGEPNSTDLIAVTTEHYPVAANDLGFRATDDLIVSSTEFVRDDDTVCTVDIGTMMAGTCAAPGALKLTIDGVTYHYPSHSDGLAAFFRWCGHDDLPEG